MLALEKFESKKRNVCRSCRHHERNLTISSSHYRYLHFTFRQLHYTRKKQGMTWNLLIEDLYELWDKQEGKCAYSGIPMTFDRTDGGTGTNATIDRINPEGSYTRNNIQLIAKVVNLMKHVHTEEDFLNWVKRIYETKIQTS